jgi:hypothetical protein
MAISGRSERLFREMRKLTAELNAIGHERDEAQIDAMLAYPVAADLSKLLRAWEIKLEKISRVESDLKDSLTDDGILPRRKKTKSVSKRSSATAAKRKRKVRRTR